MKMSLVLLVGTVVVFPRIYAGMAAEYDAPPGCRILSTTVFQCSLAGLPMIRLVFRDSGFRREIRRSSCRFLSPRFPPSFRPFSHLGGQLPAGLREGVNEERNARRFPKFWIIIAENCGTFLHSFVSCRNGVGSTRQTVPKTAEQGRTTGGSWRYRRTRRSNVTLELCFIT